MHSDEGCARKHTKGMACQLQKSYVFVVYVFSSTQLLIYKHEN